MNSTELENNSNVVKPVTKDTSTSVNIGPEINCDSVDTVNTKNNFICFNCNKKNPALLTLSNTISFISGALLDNICCCITSVHQRALATAVLTVVVLGVTAGGLAGKIIQVLISLPSILYLCKVVEFSHHHHHQK